MNHIIITALVSLAILFKLIRIPFLISVLGVEGFGIFSYLLYLFGLVLAFEAPIASLFISKIGHPGDRTKPIPLEFKSPIQRWMILLSIIASLAVSITFFITLPSFLSHIDLYDSLVILIILLISIISWTHFLNEIIFLESRGYMIYNRGLKVVQEVVFLGFAYFLSVTGNETLLTLTLTFGLAVFLIYVFSRFIRQSKTHLVEIQSAVFDFSSRQFKLSLSYVFSNNSLTLLLQAIPMIGFAASGNFEFISYYTVFTQFIAVILLFVTPIMSAYFPRLVSELENGNSSGFQRMFVVLILGSLGYLVLLNIVFEALVSVWIGVGLINFPLAGVILSVIALCELFRVIIRYYNQARSRDENTRDLYFLPVIFSIGWAFYWFFMDKSPIFLLVGSALSYLWLCNNICWTFSDLFKSSPGNDLL